MNFDSPLDWIILSFLIGLSAVILLLVFIRKSEFKRKLDYRILFIIGISWLPLGISLDNPVFIAIGSIMMLIGLANRKTWRENGPRVEPPETQKKLTIAVSLGFAALFAGGIFFFILSDPDELATSIHDELTPLFVDHEISKSDSLCIIDVPKGSIAAAHILVSGDKEFRNLNIICKGLSPKRLKTITYYELLDVPVSENTGLDSRTEKFSGQRNPYVIRRAPFRVFEVLQPANNEIHVLNQNISKAIRVEIPVSSDFPVGKHELVVKIGKFPNFTKLYFTINVHDVLIPPSASSKAKYVNWHSNERISSDHNAEIWSEEFWSMLSKYGALMAKGRQNTFWFHWASFFDFSDDGEIIKFYPERFNRYIQTFLDQGLSTIQGAPFTRRIDWSTDGILVSLPQNVERQIFANSDEGEALILGMFDRIRSQMQKNSWMSKWYQGIFDEPTNEYVVRYQKIAQLLHEKLPELKILEATMTTSLSGDVNAWCPQVHEYQKNQEFFINEANSGNEVWVYTCLVPGGPWINRLVDQERLRPVYVGWALSYYNLNGFLHWGLNHHRADPFNTLVVQHGDEKNFLPAGDSHIIYPGTDGPWSSQRFEAHRIGMEDYELLEILKLTNPVQAGVITEKLFRAFDEYEKDVSRYRAVRAELLEQLASLSL